MFYKYEMLACKVSPGMQPDGLLGYEDELGRFGVVVYDRPLTEQELSQYEMREWAGIEKEVNWDFVREVRSHTDVERWLQDMAIVVNEALLHSSTKEAFIDYLGGLGYYTERWSPTSQNFSVVDSGGKRCRTGRLAETFSYEGFRKENIEKRLGIVRGTELVVGNEKQLLYEYEMLARGVSPGALPRDFVSFDDEQGGFGVVRYDRPLTEKELVDYEMQQWSQKEKSLDQDDKDQNFINGRMVGMEKLAEEYQKQVALMQEKYSRPFREFQDGKIAVDLLRQEYAADEVIKVIGELSPSQGVIHPVYEEKLVGKALDVVKAYEAIENIKFSRKEYGIEVLDAQFLAGKRTPENEPWSYGPEDAYRVFALEILEKNPGRLLNGRDDQAIVARYLGQIDNNNEVILQTLKKASPVAKEPGRNAEKYAETIIDIVNKTYEKKVAFAQEKYPEVATAYSDKISEIRTEMQQRSEELSQRVDKNRTYFDGLIARDLLNNQFHEKNVIRAIAENSPKAVEPSERNKDKTPERYARAVIDSVKRELAAEKAILGFVPGVVGESLSLADQYRAIVKERVDLYPNTVSSLNQAFIDRDVADKMLRQEVPNADVAQAIREASPRAQMPGIPDDYAEKTVEQALSNIIGKAEQQLELETVRNEYVRQCGLAVEGISGADKEFTAYHDGRAAVKMLSDGHDVTYVRNVIAENSPRLEELSEHNVEPHKYACAIVGAAEKVIERTQALEGFIAPSEKLSVSDEYAKRMQDGYREYGYVSSRTDVDVATGMIKDGYSKENIQEAMIAVSPVAIEPGRGKNYPDYVIGRADEQIAREIRLVERFKPIEREDKAELAVDEYKHHIERFEFATRAKVTPEIDGRIVKAMLAQGYDKKEVGATIAQHSPCAPSMSNEARSYSKGVIKEVEKKLKSLQRGNGIER